MRWPYLDNLRASAISAKYGIINQSLELCDMCMLDEIRARCACRGAIRSPEVAKQRAATRSQEAARDEIYAIARAHKAEKLWVFGSCARKKREVLYREVLKV